MWSKKYERCTSCNTDLFKYKANGLCSKCHSVKLKINKIIQSQGDELDSYRIQYLGVRSDDLKKEPVTKLKLLIIDSYETRELLYLKAYGLIESEQASVEIDYLESLLNRIAKSYRKHDNPFEHKLSKFNTDFNKSQRKIIALTLLQLLI